VDVGSPANTLLQCVTACCLNNTSQNLTPHTHTVVRECCKGDDESLRDVKGNASLSDDRCVSEEQRRRAATVVDDVDEAAQLEPCSVADRLLSLSHLWPQHAEQFSMSKCLSAQPSTSHVSKNTSQNLTLMSI